MEEPATSVCAVGEGLLQSVLEAFRLLGALVIPIVAVVVIVTIARRYPADSVRWTGLRLDHAWVRRGSWIALTIGLALTTFGIVLARPQASGCLIALGPVAVVGLVVSSAGVLGFGLAWAYRTQSGWIVLATLFAVDVWLIYGMVLFTIERRPTAPDVILIIAFGIHACCLALTTLWAFRARNLSPLGQLRVGEAGRSISAVWVFLVAYLLAGTIFEEPGLFESPAGNAVIAALSLGALVIICGSGYTAYRTAMLTDPRVTGVPEPGNHPRPRPDGTGD